MPKKLYIFQFRSGKDGTTEHEQEGFNEEFADYDFGIEYVDVLRKGLPKDIPEDMIGAIFGGSGEYYLSEDQVRRTGWVRETLGYIGELLDSNIPILGICYGCHMLARYQGAFLSEEEKYREVGSLDFRLLEPAKEDSIFSQLPNNFVVQIGHKITPIQYPSHIIPLGRTEKVSVNAFRIAGKDAWGVGFHPDLTKKRIIERIALLPQYIPKGRTLQDIADETKESPEALSVLHYFAMYILQSE